ncbi:hypothetical protein F4861DRAFT_19252 [Xylaria intraflava]|nr:hypothetical protein F4861DRAFT_19252 [Xylaria intraflava]
MSAGTWKIPRGNEDDGTLDGFRDRHTVEGIVITFSLVSWICVLLRLHTRYQLRCLGWDDFIVVPFRISATLGSVFILLLYNYGFGKHFWVVSPPNQHKVLQTYYVALLSYTISTTFMKLCLLAQFIRLFGNNKRARQVCWVFIVICAVWGIVFIILSAVPCVPVAEFWNRTGHGHCYGFGSLDAAQNAGTYVAHVASNVALDLIVLAIPIPLYFKTFKTKKQRVGFTIMVLLGISINAISIWRLNTIVVTQAGAKDPTYFGPQSIVLASIEVDLASIVASIPVFWPMLTQSWGAIFVTKEVLVTHHHRRLSASGEDQFELRPATRSSSHERAGSDGSLKLIIMKTERHNGSRDTSLSRGHDRSLSAQGRKDYEANDPYIRGRVYPIGGGVVASNTQVVSEGQRGFERNYKEQLEMSVSADKLDKNTSSMEQGRSMEPRDPAYIAPLSRRTSDRF